MSHELCIAGPFPPPRHGVSTINESVAKLAADAGFNVTCLNTAPVSLNRSPTVKLVRLWRVARAIVGVRRFARAHPGATVYLSLSGGWGLLYEVFMVQAARQYGARVVVHHHSFRYLDAGFWPMRCLVRASGTGALHIVLGQIMAERLQHRYPAITQILTLSNATFLPCPEASVETCVSGAFRVGHLSNLSAAKGLEDMLAWAELSARRKLPWEFVIAGPFENKADADRYLPRMAALYNLRYAGPLYGPSKDEFFKNIDVFAFPTRYQHEAEPLVVLEAMRHGCPVIAYARGCISEILGNGGGQAISSNEDFVATAVEVMGKWHDEGVRFRHRGDAVRRRFEELQAQGAQAIIHILERSSSTTP